MKKRRTHQVSEIKDEDINISPRELAIDSPSREEEQEENEEDEERTNEHHHHHQLFIGPGKAGSGSFARNRKRSKWTFIFT